eukprot:s7143_g3.t1
MDCLAAACHWLCSSSTPARPLDRPVVVVEPEWGPFKGASAASLLQQSEESPKSLSAEEPRDFREADMDSQVCGTAVILNIYHVTQSTGVQWLNTLFAYEHAPVKLGGLFHVGVQVGDEEWAFGATLAGSGVCRHKPRGAEQHHFRESLPMGSTTLSKRELDVLYRTLDALLQQESSDAYDSPLSFGIRPFPEGTWSGMDYSLLQNNCIDFAIKVCRLLKVADVPAWVNRPLAASSLSGLRV